MRAIKKLEFGQNERNERLSNKRKEILSRMEASLRAKRESELRRRTERVTNPSYEPMEKDSDDESGSDPMDKNDNSEPLGRGVFPDLAQDYEGRDGSTISPSLIRRKTRLGTIGTSSSATIIQRLDEPSDDFFPPLGRRITSVSKSGNGSRENRSTEDSVFSFLSEWGKRDEHKIRW
jgi:hypothetical protein